MNCIKKLFEIERSPRRGLLTLEWVMLAYMALTLLIILFTYTKVEHPQAMIWGRARIVAMTVAMLIVYRLIPCRFTLCARISAQMLLLAWWYPDTYEFNRMFPNLDHIFATAEQSIFGFQPALTFAAHLPSVVASELMNMGYASYYPMIALITYFYFFRRYGEFERVTAVIMAAFFISYVMYIFIPVAGPTFYYKAIGLENAARGIFPNIHDYFNTHTDCLPTPGYADGVFYHMVESAKAAGERPTAAFPSSHVSIATLCICLALHARSRGLVLFLLPFYVLLCFATVYIQAHYAIDAIAGLIVGLLFYAGLMFATRSMKKTGVR